MGFFLINPFGEIYGLLASLGVILIIMLLADRLLLVSIGAKEISKSAHDVMFIIQNQSCKLGLSNIRVYKSFKVPAGVYCLHPIFNRPCLILSNDFFEIDSSQMREIYLVEALEFIKSGRGRFSSLVSYVAFLIFFPAHLFNRLSLKSCSILFLYALLPLYFLKDYVVESNYRSILRGKDEFIQASYHLERFKNTEKNIVNYLITDFSVFRKKDVSLWATLLGGYDSIFSNYVKLNERKAE